ncbi:hypothetical protein AQUCO_01300327v1 [Aquilegia coerulea]|uniref:Uncharacterized protein n=1 Tax=Aquilegia coerulea TaxID=218851 RepID=A0A2G5E141_AQUCA|nr:hypothetical protein AQUCO_01300327v1 [Aquilegia coerulea]
MEPLWKLIYLFEPAPLTLMLTAITVTFASAFRALTHGKEMERNRDFSESSITLDGPQALMIPLMSSCSLLLMFYLFSSLSQFLTIFTTAAAVFSLFFCFSPFVAYFNSKLGLVDPFLSRCCAMSFTRTQGLLFLVCIGIVGTWLVTGHWVLNNLLERLFGANVMVAVATQKASNPVHMVANSLSLPGLQLIAKKIELPVKIVFPRNLLGGDIPGSNSADFMMLGLGDMAIPGMLLAFVLCFDHQRSKESINPLNLSSLRGQTYIWYALPGYAIGLVVALATGTLTHAPQPALLFLVPSTLGPIIFISWIRKEFMLLWEGTETISKDKDRELEV